MDLDSIWWRLERLERELRDADRHSRFRRPAFASDTPIDRLWEVRSALWQSTHIVGSRLTEHLAGIDLSSTSSSWDSCPTCAC
jgi:hypothetical protein